MFNAFDGIHGRNPRTVIGYFEPGQYCLVTADGRSLASRGLPLGTLAELMESLGCTRAYNLDGGESTMLTWFEKVINKPYKDGRAISDAVIIMDIE